VQKHRNDTCQVSTWELGQRKPRAQRRARGINLEKRVPYGCVECADVLEIVSYRSPSRKTRTFTVRGFTPRVRPEDQSSSPSALKFRLLGRVFIGWEYTRAPQTRSRRRAFCLPCVVGEVASARSWRMTEGSVYTHGDPSVSSSTYTKGVLLDPLPLPSAGED
jgi:hypothetical protein